MGENTAPAEAKEAVQQLCKAAVIGKQQQDGRCRDHGYQHADQQLEQESSAGVRLAGKGRAEEMRKGGKGQQECRFEEIRKDQIGKAALKRVSRCGVYKVNVGGKRVGIGKEMKDRVGA